MSRKGVNTEMTANRRKCKTNHVVLKLIWWDKRKNKKKKEKYKKKYHNTISNLR